ncbi:hypothetical protein HK104_006556 [Borealophlyctis nickersoniae]|nr:hypothetical protein HK104_006556 [Borealophlyctis nickersoniae]
MQIRLGPRGRKALLKLAMSTPRKEVAVSEDNALITKIKQFIYLANMIVDTSESPGDCGASTFRKNPQLAYDIVNHMPTVVQEAFTTGQIREPTELCKLPEVTNDDVSPGCYLIVIERQDGTFGVYAGTSGYLKEDGTPNWGSLWNRFETHKSSMKSKKKRAKNPLYRDMRISRRWRLVPILRWYGLRVFDMEFLESAIGIVRVWLTFALPSGRLNKTTK